MTYVIICSIVLLLVNAFAALEFREIAELKGHDGSKYFWWCFLTGAAGWSMVIALPDRKAKNWTTERNDSASERANISISEYKISKNDDELPDL